MKTINPSSKFFVRLVGGLAAVALAAAFALLPASTVYADEGTPPAPDGKRAERLEKALQREQEWLDIQQNNLDRANELAEKVQARIDELKAEGKDTSALEAALATYRAEIADALASHNTAAGILSAHTGFDENGHVTDPEQARQTVLDARESLQDARLALRNALLDLRIAIRDFRRASR
jgi:DNA repair exonuclease SbcCD ATPase subunit